MKNPKISIIIPVLNEETIIKRLFNHLKDKAFNNQHLEIIVVDGGSSDKTTELAKGLSTKVIASKKGRAVQMNTGAKHAQGQLLYFLHADTLPPENFDKFILAAAKQNYQAGCFRMRFDSSNPILKFFAWLSRINHTLCRGGDQSLFVSKTVFENSGGFNEEYLIYEDSEFIRRLYSVTKFKVIPEHVITSARKYRQHGWLRVQYHFGMIHLKNYFGASADELYGYYSKNLL